MNFISEYLNCLYVIGTPHTSVYKLIVIRLVYHALLHTCVEALKVLYLKWKIEKINRNI